MLNLVKKSFVKNLVDKLKGIYAIDDIGMFSYTDKNGKPKEIYVEQQGDLNKKNLMATLGIMSKHFVNTKDHGHFEQINMKADFSDVYDLAIEKHLGELPENPRSIGGINEILSAYTKQNAYVLNENGLSKSSTIFDFHVNPITYGDFKKSVSELRGFKWFLENGSISYKKGTAEIANLKSNISMNKDKLMAFAKTVVRHDEIKMLREFSENLNEIGIGLSDLSDLSYKIAINSINEDEGLKNIATNVKKYDKNKIGYSSNLDLFKTRVRGLAEDYKLPPEQLLNDMTAKYLK